MNMSNSMNWIKTDNGGYSDTEQQVSWQDILDWQVQMFFYSCYLYYVLDDPKLEDAAFDRIIDIMELYFDQLPERITNFCDPGQIKETAHLFAHELTEQEEKDALLWKNNRL